MTTLKDAEAARALHAERLRRLGAHAIIVKQVKRKGRKTFVVLALFERVIPRGLIKRLPIERRGKPITVELVAKASPLFHPD